MLLRCVITRKLMVFFFKKFFSYKWLPETCSSFRLEGMGTTSWVMECALSVPGNRGRAWPYLRKDTRPGRDKVQVLGGMTQQALRCRTPVKAQNIMGSQKCRKQRRGWRKNFRDLTRLISIANLEIIMPLSSWEDPPTLMASPTNFFKDWVSVPIWCGLSPVDTVINISPKRDKVWGPGYTLLLQAFKSCWTQ